MNIIEIINDLHLRNGDTKRMHVLYVMDKNTFTVLINGSACMELLQG